MTDSKQATRRETFPIWAWIAATALALVTGYSVRQMGIQTTQISDLRKQMRSAELQNQALQVKLDLGRQLSSIMASPDSKIWKLAPRDAKLPIMLAYLHPQMGVALIADQMPAMTSERTLQLWTLPKKGAALSVALFRPDLEGLVALVAPIRTPIDEIEAFGVSEEAAGGSPQPTSAFKWTAQIK